MGPDLVSVRTKRDASILVSLNAQPHSPYGNFVKVIGWPCYETAVLPFQTFHFHEGTVLFAIWLVILMLQDPEYSRIASIGLSFKYNHISSLESTSLAVVFPLNMVGFKRSHCQHKPHLKNPHI